MATSTTATPIAVASANNNAASVVTVTVAASSTADVTTDSDGNLVSSTMSLIYIYSAATTEAEPTATSSSSASAHLAGGAIAGIVVGCIAFLILLALGLFCYSRKVARKRRRQRAPSALRIPTAASRYSLPRAQAHSYMDVNSPTTQHAGAIRNDRSGGTNSRSSSSRNHHHHHQQYQQARSSPRTPRSGRHFIRPTTEKIPEHSDRHELEVGRGQQSPNVHEMYGSYVHPVELQAGSMTNLVAEVAQIKKAKVTEKIVTTSITRPEKDYPDSASTGYLSPTWPPPSRGGTMSDIDETDASTILTHDGASGYGARSLQSIHVYFSPGPEYGGPAAAAEISQAAALSRRQSQIALAFSQAASSPKSPKSPNWPRPPSATKVSRDTMRSPSAAAKTR